MATFWNNKVTYVYGADWKEVPGIWSDSDYDNSVKLVYKTIPINIDNVPVNSVYYPLAVQAQQLYVPVPLLSSRICTNIHSTVDTVSGFHRYSGGTSNNPEGVWFRSDEVNVEPAVLTVDGNYNPTSTAIPMMFKGATYNIMAESVNDYLKLSSDIESPNSWTNGYIFSSSTLNPNITTIVEEPYRPDILHDEYYVSKLDIFGFNKNMYIISNEINKPIDLGIPYFSTYQKCIDYVEGRIGIEEADNYEELANGFEYDIYIEGSNLPIINIVWKNDYVKESGVDYSNWKFIMECEHCAQSNLYHKFIIGFSEAKFSTTYRELLRKTDIENYSVVVSGGREKTYSFSSGFINATIYIEKDSIKSDKMFITIYDSALNGSNAQGTNVGTGSSSVVQYRFTPTTGHVDRNIVMDYSTETPTNCIGYRTDEGYNPSFFGYNCSNFPILNIYVHSYTLNGVGNIVNTSKTQDGSFIMLYSGSGIEDDYQYPHDESQDKVVGDDEMFTGILTNSYAITRAQAQQIGGKLWSETFINDIRLVNSNPIESIIGLSRFPFRVSADSNSTPIFIGNVNIDVEGRENFKSNRITIATFDFPSHYDSYLDFNPYSHFYLFLPFVGLKELDIEKYYNRQGIKITYVIDYLTGDCIVAIMLSDNTVMDLYGGSMGVSLQLSNSGLNELTKKYASALVNAGVDIAGTVSTAGTMNSSSAKTAMGVSSGANIAGDLANTFLTSSKHTTSSGKIDSACMFNLSMQVYYIYELCAFQEPSLYNHTHGKPCNLTKRIGALSGFTRIDSDTDLSGLTCTVEEMNELRDILTSGFYA